ncbi:adenylate and guanylate cyclase catalytic domain-containing protein [Baffinella frigidus]|nr:adenylate and guanylate cyclase catalytic domain-containing protein [Cryptophyta sp. CCMP2293]
MMPKNAIAKLQKGQSVIEKYDMVTIFFSDIIGFTNMVSEMTPIQVMAMLNELYTIFDALVEKHGVYKVETIGDAYMVLGGAPNLCPPSEGAEKVAKFALAALDAVRNFRREDGTTVLIRAGLASGPVVAGVIGSTMPRYDLFGDTVNFASRMESTSQSMQIQIAELTHFLLKNAQGKSLFDMSLRLGDDGLPGIPVKGKGRVTTYWIHGMQGVCVCVCVREREGERESERAREREREGERERGRGRERAREREIVCV